MYRQYVSSKVMPVKITHFKYNIAHVFFTKYIYIYGRASRPVTARPLSLYIYMKNIFIIKSTVVFRSTFFVCVYNRRKSSQ